MQDPNRFQYRPWYVRLWRRRHLISIPYRAIRTWWKALNTHSPLSFKNAWSIEHGWAHIAMDWYYTSEEIMERLNEKRITRNTL